MQQAELSAKAFNFDTLSYLSSDYLCTNMSFYNVTLSHITDSKHKAWHAIAVANNSIP
jgi:hypothetical protein